MAGPYKPYSKREYLNGVVPQIWPPGSLTVSTVYDLTANGFKQRPPYTATAYEASIHRRIDGDAGPYGGSPSPDLEAAATNKAHAKIVSTLGDASQWGSTLTSEGSQLKKLLVGTSVKLLQSARAVRRGQFTQAARILGVEPPVQSSVLVVKRRKSKKDGTYYEKRLVATRSRLVLPSGRTVAKTSANSWLWWSYGVKPLMQDIYNTVDVLQRPDSWTKVKGSSTASSKQSYRAGNESVTVIRKCNVSVSCSVRVVNPNLRLATQLGLVNPVQIINEGIPFSFVVDWFSNLSQYISQWTDFGGLEIAKPVTAVKHQVKGIRVLDPTNYPSGPNRTYHWTRAGESRYLYRRLSMPSVKLRFEYERFEWQRGANAISLLIGLLPKK